jgi:hypothetical protein
MSRQAERMVMTILEAHVAPERWTELEHLYTTTGSRLPPQMVQTFLVQSTNDTMLWRGISIWRSSEALEEYRRSVETPGGILMFRAVNAEPTLSLFEVAVALQPSD